MRPSNTRVATTTPLLQRGSLIIVDVHRQDRELSAWATFHGKPRLNLRGCRLKRNANTPSSNNQAIRPPVLQAWTFLHRSGFHG